MFNLSDVISGILITSSREICKPNPTIHIKRFLFSLAEKATTT